MKRVFILEDDDSSRIILETALIDFDLCVVKTLAEAKTVLTKEKFDVYLLDLFLPDGESTHLFDEKLIPSNSLIYFISGSEDIDHQLLSFELGATDFINKPFKPLVLKAKIDSAIQKTGNFSVSNTVAGNLQIDDLAKQLLVDSQPVDNLTKTEFRILKYLVENKNKVKSREQIMLEVIGSDANSTQRTIDAHISKIRKKLDSYTRTIVAVYGFGYKIDDFSFTKKSA